MRFRLMSTSFERESTMFTKEKYMNCRADIDDALNSSDFAIQSIFSPDLLHHQLLIVKKDENDNPVNITWTDVRFLQHRFKSLGFPVTYKQLLSYASFAFYFGAAINIAEFTFEL